MGLPRGVYPELCKILPLHGVYPEQDSSVAEFTLSEAEVLPQNDKMQRVQGQNDTERRARNDDSSC